MYIVYSMLVLYTANCKYNHCKLINRRRERKKKAVGERGTELNNPFISYVVLLDPFQVSASGKGVLITGCDSPLAWYLAKKLDDLGFTVYAGFNTPIDESDEAKILKEETSGRMKLLHLDVSSEKSVSTIPSKRERSFSA